MHLSLALVVQDEMLFYGLFCGSWEVESLRHMPPGMPHYFISFYIQLCKLKTVLGNPNLCILVEILLL